MLILLPNINGLNFLNKTYKSITHKFHCLVSIEIKTNIRKKSRTEDFNLQQIRCIAIIQFCIAIKCHITLSIFTYIAYFKHNQFELSIENSEHLNNFIPKYHTKNLKCIFKTRKICFFTKFSF